MTEVFGSSYAITYDAVYAAKDYGAECDAIERAFSEFSRVSVRRVLDLGCGTGGHAIPLAARGYGVTGIDRSPDMLAVAARKGRAAGLDGSLAWRQADLTQRPELGQHDAVLMMFNAMGYLLEAQSLVQLLGAVRESLPSGALFVLDLWDAAGVLKHPPSTRVTGVVVGDRHLERRSHAALDPAAQTCRVMIELTDPQDPRFKVSEVHAVRFFRRAELTDLFRRHGLEVLRWGGLPEYWKEPAGAWSVMVIARAV
ncbi:MAG: class I SAM-dependent methyltransferase [Pseudomonadota bacterium]